MSYKYSKGSQVIGDLKAADDTQRDTLIDFGEDIIDFQTSGSSVLKISGSEVYLNDGSNIRMGTDSTIYFDGYDTTNDCYITQHPDNSLYIDGNNFVQLVADQAVYVQHNGVIKANFDFSNNIAKINMPIQMNATDPTITYRNSDGTEKATIGVNSSDNILIENKTINKHIVFKVNDQGTVREGFRINGTVPEVVVNEGSSSLVDFRVESSGNTHMLFVDGGNDRVGLGVSTPAHSLEVSGNVYLSGTLSHGDVMLLELSVPNVDLQTDTYAHRIYAPYNMDIDNVMYILDSHNTSGNVTVTLTNTTSNTLMSSVTMAGNAVTGSDFTITSASVAQGDSLTFAITEAAGASQGLHAMLYFRRSI